MLIDIDTGRQITTVPFAPHYRLLESQLSAAEFLACVNRINELIEEGGGRIATAGWLPGADWSGTVFMPIYEKAARRNQELSAKLFGLLVWKVIMDRDERWGSGRYQVDGRDIGSRTYFRLR
jgi:hypothetical protein